MTTKSVHLSLASTSKTSKKIPALNKRVNDNAAFRCFVGLT